MARKPGIEYSGALVHVIVKTNNREEICRDDEDRRAYFERRGLYLTEGGVAVHSCCLMPNRVHLLAERGEHPLSQVL